MIAASKALAALNSWETIRYELLQTRICDLELKIKGSPVEAHIKKLYAELSLKKIIFKPEFYFTDSWGCPDQIPVIGIPFYLADKRLMRLEEEQTGEIESDTMIDMYLRHETGHAINYAYRLWEYPEWSDTFGLFSRPYRDTFRPRLLSRQFVRHISHSQYGRTYAQKHPDEDFAETFAVWLTPKSGWRRKYRNWPAFKKLEYVDILMKKIRNIPALSIQASLVNPIEKLTISLAEYYGQEADKYRAAAQGYVDDKLKSIFPPITGRNLVSAAELLRANHHDLIARITRWSGLSEEEVNIILVKLEKRAEELGLHYRRAETVAKMMDITSLATSLAMDFAYTGRLIG